MSSCFAAINKFRLFIEISMSVRKPTVGIRLFYDIAGNSKYFNY